MFCLCILWSSATQAVAPQIVTGDQYAVALIADGTSSLTPVPYVSNWSEAAGRGVLFNYVFQGMEPLGGYAINGFFTAPGTLTSAGIMAGGNFALIEPVFRLRVGFP